MIFPKDVKPDSPGKGPGKGDWGWESVGDESLDAENANIAQVTDAIEAPPGWEDDPADNLVSEREIPDIETPEVVNYSPFPMQIFQTVDQHASVFHTAVLRVTFDMHKKEEGSEVMHYAQEHTPLCDQDMWVGEPNASAPLWESDFAPYKPRCDVMVVNAQAKPGKICEIKLHYRTEEDPKQFKVWKKRIAVKRPRKFGVLLGLTELDSNEALVDIDYAHAFGGEIKDPAHDILDANGKLKVAAGSRKWKADMRNPVGMGYSWTGAAPQLEKSNSSFHAGVLQTNYPPMAFTCIGRGWQPRAELAGTFDEKWKNEQWPLPPLNHDYAYWQSAPLDQQIDYPLPGATLELHNLVPNMDAWTGRLPKHTLFLLAHESEGDLVTYDLLLDTLIADPKNGQVIAVYRCNIDAHQPLDLIEVRVAPLYSDDPEPLDKYQLSFSDEAITEGRV